MSNRLRLYQLSEQELILFFRTGDKLPEVIMGLQPLGIPEGAIVHHVYQMPDRRSFGVVIHHDSFKEVGLCDLISIEPDPITIRKVAYAVIENKFAIPLELVSTKELKALKEVIDTELYDRERS